jgi:NAD(P) transhydrogenase subunit alpha
MAVESGGNVEGSVPDEIVETNGVKIIGLTNLASYVADHASYALSNNLVNFITDFYDQEKKSMNLDMSDEIISSALLVQNGEVIKEMFK